MKLISLALLTILMQSTVPVNAQPVKTLKKVLELKMPREDGANGASVAWHPGLKKYYAAMAGNVSFPLSVFDAAGKSLSPAEQETLFDIRGLWYYPKLKTIQMNGYNKFGWAEYKLNTKGFPVEIKELYPGMNQSNENCAGSFNPKENAVYFFNEDGNLDAYDYGTAEYLEAKDLYLGNKNENEFSDNYDVLENYNSTTAVFTGIPKAEIGVLNVAEKQIELYNIATGYLTQILKLPGTAPAKEWLNFAWSNNIYWLFDTESRTWKGYK
jgi:hypothetical protein